MGLNVLVSQVIGLNVLGPLPSEHETAEDIYLKAKANIWP